MRALFGTILLAATLQSTFDVASIKRNTTAGAVSDTVTTPGRVNLINVTLFSVVLRAFGVLDAQVAGAPDWLRTERYDIVAVTGDATALTDDVRQKYLQSLLAERCGLVFHRERRELRVYSLVPSKAGARIAVPTGSGDYAMRLRPADAGRLRLQSTKGNMRRLAEILSGQMGDLVVDRTGLAGQYDFTLEW